MHSAFQGLFNLPLLIRFPGCFVFSAILEGYSTYIHFELLKSVGNFSGKSRCPSGQSQVNDSPLVSAPPLFRKISARI